MKTKATAIGVALAALAVLCAMFAASASAASWKFEGKSLEGSEVVVGAAIDSSLTIPGLTTKCENFLYKLNVKNEGTTGKGEVTELPLYNCTTDQPEVCTVNTIAAEKLPWAAKVTTVSTSNYIVIEGIKVGIKYAGVECALGGITVNVTGTAGGLLENATETATFNSTTFGATKTELKALATKIQWTGLFPTEAFQWHREQALSVS
jgi:hypothetical protein